MRSSYFVVLGTTFLLASCIIEKHDQCGPDPCNGHGVCDDSGSSITCTCDPGYAGNGCGTCATGFHFDNAGVCAADESCAAIDCGPHGQCVVTGGEAACVCDPGYGQSGDACLATCVDPDQDFWGEGAGCLGPDNCPQVANFDQADVDGDGTGDLCDTEAISDVVWSPDGARIAFVRCPPDQNENCELWVAESDRYNARMIHTGVSVSGLQDWYGDSILFIADNGIGRPSSYDGTGELFSIHSDGTGLTRVSFTYSNGTHCHCNSYWEPLGTVAWGRFVRGTDQVYFRANNGNGWWRTYLVNADGSDGQTTFSSGYAWYSWTSPTGDVLLYAEASNYNQPMTLRAVDRVGGGSVTLASGLAPPVSVAVSPDGSKVAYVAAGAADRDIHVVGIDGTGDTVINAGTSQDLLEGFYNGSELEYRFFAMQPWSADGQWLVLSSDRDGLSHLYKVHPDGTGLAAVTSGAGYQFSAALSPDGSRIAYHQLPEGFSSTAPLYQLIVEDW